MDRSEREARRDHKIGGRCSNRSTHRGAAGTVGTLYVADTPERGERGPTGPPGPQGDRGKRGPEPNPFETAEPLDPDEVWQVIESDTTRLTDNVEFPEEEDPAAQDICDAMQSSSISELQDVGYSC